VSIIYESIGRLVVAFVWRRFGSQIRVGLAVAAVGGIVAAYLAASRDVDEA
jgi:hypothetical protein